MSSSKKGGMLDKFYKEIAPIITGVGAAIVILGALFKIQHYPGAGIMLIVGLSTEAVLFLMFAFAPPEPHMANMEDWARVYPEIMPEEEFEDEDEEEEGETKPAIPRESPTKKLDEMMANAKIGPELFDSLGKGLQSFTKTVSNMRDISEASVATDEYAKNVKTASKSIVDMNKSYSSTVSAMSEMTAASKDAKEYHQQVQNVTKNLSALNAVYEMELQDANSHLKSMNKFYSTLSVAMDNMTEASKNTEKFKNEVSSLTSNLASLNRIYGTMLSAMRMGASEGNNASAGQTSKS